MIVNNPIGKDAIMHPHAHWDNVFSNDELSKIIEECEKHELERGFISSNGVQDQRRISSLNFHKMNAENKWIFDRLNNLIDFINENFFGFNLSGYEFFQFSTYKGEELGKYDTHIDCVMGAVDHSNGGLHRKLSMSLLLNDEFEGGDFEIHIGKPLKIKIPKGRALFFPSFIPHAVSPVTEGTRKSLVLWVLGPKFK